MLLIFHTKNWSTIRFYQAFRFRADEYEKNVHWILRIACANSLNGWNAIEFKSVVQHSDFGIGWMKRKRICVTPSMKTNLSICSNSEREKCDTEQFILYCSSWNEAQSRELKRSFSGYFLTHTNTPSIYTFNVPKIQYIRSDNRYKCSLQNKL